MKILRTYLKPNRWLILLSLLLAAVAQLLSLVDPIIFGMIIDDYALQQDVRTERGPIAMQLNSPRESSYAMWRQQIGER